MKTPQEKQIDLLLTRQGTYSDCTDLLIAAVNDYAALVGVERFSLCPSYNNASVVLFHLENHEQGNWMGSILDLGNEQAITVFLGMIAQAQSALGKKGPTQ